MLVQFLQLPNSFLPCNKKRVNKKYELRSDDFGKKHMHRSSKKPSNDEENKVIQEKNKSLKWWILLFFSLCPLLREGMQGKCWIGAKLIDCPLIRKFDKVLTIFLFVQIFCPLTRVSVKYRFKCMLIQKRNKEIYAMLKSCTASKLPFRFHVFVSPKLDIKTDKKAQFWVNIFLGAHTLTWNICSTANHNIENHIIFHN